MKDQKNHIETHATHEHDDLRVVGDNHHDEHHERGDIHVHKGEDHVHSEDHHRDPRGGAARAAVFGISDGLVSNLSLILGFAGASAGAGTVRLAGIAGMIAGAISMAAGEYVSMRAQTELLERELAMERHEIIHNPEAEKRELEYILRKKGINQRLAHELVEDIHKDVDIALQAHAKEELGIDPEELGSAVEAAGSSFVAFAIGAVIPLAPWFFFGGNGATLTTVVLAGLAAIGIGVALAYFTGRSYAKSGLRQFAIAAFAAAATYGIGSLVGTPV